MVDDAPFLIGVSGGMAGGRVAYLPASLEDDGPIMGTFSKSFAQPGRFSPLAMRTSSIISSTSPRSLIFSASIPGCRAGGRWRRVGSWKGRCRTRFGG